MTRALIVALALISSPALADDAATPQGAKVYQRCAACHLPNGAGVPGAFPQLAGRVSEAAMTDTGRNYLVMAVTAGLMGEIYVNGAKIRGVMPAQAGLSAADIASALNYAASLKSPGADAEAKPAAKPRSFTAEEVSAIQAKFAGANPNSVHELRTGAFPPAGAAAK